MIESNVSIDQSVVCDNVVIGAGAVIPRGCVLSYGVVIGAGAVLKEYTRVSRHDGDDEVRLLRVSSLYFLLSGVDGTFLRLFVHLQDDPQDLCEIDSTKSLGNGSVGFVWTPRDGTLLFIFVVMLTPYLFIIFKFNRVFVLQWSRTATRRKKRRTRVCMAASSTTSTLCAWAPSAAPPTSGGRGEFLLLLSFVELVYFPHSAANAGTYLV